MLFHVDLLWAAGVNQSLIFINKALSPGLKRLNAIQQGLCLLIWRNDFLNCVVTQIKLSQSVHSL